MALAEMCKARIAVHKSVAYELVGKLQALGCCEFVEQEGSTLDSRAMLQLHANQHEIEELLSDVRFVLRMLEPFETEKEGSLARMLGDIPAIGLSELASKVDKERFKSFVADLREKERKMTEYRAESSRLKGLLSQAALLKSIKYPLELFTTGSEMIGGAVYSVLKSSAAEMISKLKSGLGDFFEFQELEPNGKDSFSIFAILYRKEDQEKVQDICTELSANRIDVPKEFVLTADEELERIKVSVDRLEKDEASVCSELAGCADEGMAMARTCGDYWTILKDRINSMVSGLPTEDVFIWSFWMPEVCLAKVKKTIEPYESMMEFAVIGPDENEEAPTLLKNASWSSSVEPLTLMFGTPSYGGVDPTSLMAPFFFVFLGMCFGDAGYGLVMSGIIGYFLIRHRLQPTLRKFFIMLNIGMLCSVIFGAITGSWFGDSVSAFPFMSPLLPLKNALQLLDPMNDPMTLLMISLALGFIQIIFGLLIAFRNNWKNGERFAACADQGGWIVFLVGLLLVGISMSGAIPGMYIIPSKITAAAGALILVATQGRGRNNIAGKIFSGVMSLYNVTGYLGDVLSYSRLLALGLGSAAVGMVINLLAKLVVGVPYVGLILAILIFVLGHTFSIAVNLLGAFIHSLRLQYVEFFGKFYDANGRDFTPLRNSTMFARLEEDSAAQ